LTFQKERRICIYSVEAMLTKNVMWWWMFKFIARKWFRYK